MKTNSPNVLFNHQTNLPFEKTSQVMKQKLLLLLMLVSFCSGVFAQQGLRASQDGTVVVTELNSLLASARTSGTARIASSGTSAVNIQRLNDLVTQVQSSTYFYQGVVKTYGDAPTNLYTDASSLGQVNNSITEKQNIEIVTILINTTSELNSVIDLAAFSNFPNLKYIYFISNINTTSNVISSHIGNYDSRFSIFYKVDKGDRNQ
ncbi:hypothetical protein [Flavobacterium sp. N1994]|uniref:hypothetical protein n=1 Tax=Flavobacterium sp. N1994 TaxID=2986827 RepID=UPI0022228E33|nr:hypothetical protein [Flavobacterium sp. N1994]